MKMSFWTGVFRAILIIVILLYMVLAATAFTGEMKFQTNRRVLEPSIIYRSPPPPPMGAGGSSP
ncbi:hypothetical protein QJS04_geneDACA009172 [Acorus gramineus]|uniref:Proline rich protein n=1 Tax=Acorus gramineus TaxID=55184 RepID=A0AAV9AUH1_ACOGR|nr:hypothetical protein QJS04_geneDACA009172 [Acorus gramineus]